MAQLVVLYPTPIELETGQYALFTMNARSTEIRAIAATLVFTA